MKNTRLYPILFSLLLLALSSGAQGFKWGATCTMTTNSISEGGPTAADNNGNVYGANLVIPQPSATGVISSTYGPYTVVDNSGTQQTVIFRLDSSGHYIWAHGLQGGRADMLKVATDAANNVYYLGATDAPFSIGTVTYTPASVHFILKINPAGLVLWFKDFPGQLFPNDISVLPSGTLYFTGTLSTLSPFTYGSSTIDSSKAADAFIAAMDSSGTPQWLTALGGSGDDAGYYVYAGAGGEVFAAGTSTSPTLNCGSNTLTNPMSVTGSFSWVVKLRPDHSVQWGSGVTNSSVQDAITGIAADNLNNVYAGGYFSDSISSGGISIPHAPGGLGQIFLFRYDSGGHAKWGKTVSTPWYWGAESIDADNCGNVWLACQGGSVPVYNTDVMWLAHFDSTGKLRDSFSLTSGGDDASFISLDKKGNFYLSGDYARVPVAEEYPFALGNDTLPMLGSVDEALFVGKYIYDLPGCVRDTIPYHYSHTGVPALAVGSFGIYPNPAQREITVVSETGIEMNTTLELTDMTGRTLGRFALMGKSTRINLPELPPGMFFCRISDGGPVFKLEILR